MEWSFVTTIFFSLLLSFQIYAQDTVSEETSSVESPSGADSGIDVELKVKTSLTDPPEDDLLPTEDPNEPEFKDMQPMNSLDLLEPSSLK